MSTAQGSSKIRHKSKGEQTKGLILAAAIKVLARNGIKGTTHRAIALEANIQLSLTTYYFKDINQLVHEAFTLNSANVTAKAGAAWKLAFQLIESYSKTELRRVSTREALSDKLSAMSSAYLADQITKQPTELAVEQLLFTEIQITPELRSLAKQHKTLLLSPFIKLCRYFNKQDPELNADIMLTMYKQIEYRNLADDFDEQKREEINQVTQRIIRWIMGLKS